MANTTACVVAIGNPFDGIVMYGPFDTTDDANEWADHEVSNDTWWVMSLMDPASD